MLIIIFIFLGIILGIIISLLVFTILAFFRAGIEQKVKVIEKNLAIAGPRPKGFIVEPESEAEQIRQALIERNRKAGRDTHISELR